MTKYLKRLNGISKWPGQMLRYEKKQASKIGFDTCFLLSFYGRADLLLLDD